MRTIHLDAVGGIAGDMFVAALLDALPELRDRVLTDGRAVLPVDAGAIRLEAGLADAIAVLRFGLDEPAGGQLSARTVGSAVREHAHAGQGHHHSHIHQHSHDTPAAHGGDHAHDDAGTFRDMVARIEAAKLQQGTTSHAIAILTILAEAESTIHGVPRDEVHFHEIADWDSLLDVVAAGSIAAALEETRWTVSSLPRGGGLVHTRHGLLPVPAPATAAILTGFEWRDDGVSGERVTPTGAAILKHLVDPASRDAAGRLAASGTGAGTRSMPGIPNILRALVFESATDVMSDRVAVLEFEVDDMTGEEIAVACDRLRLAEGVLDVSTSQRTGKKGRPATTFHVLSRPETSAMAAERCFAETSTIGLRIREDRRLVLAREAATGAGVAVKAVARPGGRTIKAESDALEGDTLAARRALKRRAEEGELG